MAPRCREYLADADTEADIVLSAELYDLGKWPELSADMAGYMESGHYFYGNLLRFNGMMLHASAVEYEGRAYLFSGPSTVGKSTHTRLWQHIFGDAVRVINDDKPALRLVDGCWYAYGTPWCGKDGINQNRKAPLAGICFLKQGKENRIRRLEAKEAIALILSQTMYRFRLPENLDLLLHHVDKLVRMIPIYELENLPEEAAARLCYGTMRAGTPECNTVP